MKQGFWQCWCGRITKVDLDDMPAPSERCEFAAHHVPARAVAADANQLRAVIGKLATQIAAGRPQVELMETIREGTRPRFGTKEWANACYAEMSAFAENKLYRSHHQTTPGRVSLTIRGAA